MLLKRHSKRLGECLSVHGKPQGITQKEDEKFIITLISLSFFSEQAACLAWLGKKVRPWERVFMIVSNG